MAKKKQVGRRVEGWKAKSWFKVYTPDNLGKAYIGDTIASDVETVRAGSCSQPSARSPTTTPSSTSR